MKLSEREAEVVEEMKEKESKRLEMGYNQVAIKYGPQQAKKIAEPYIERINLLTRILNESERGER